MERLNSGDFQIVFGTNFEYSQHWSDEMGKSRMAGGEGLFMVIQDAMPLILHYRTMY